jgi:hypothetical protein
VHAFQKGFAFTNRMDEVTRLGVVVTQSGLFFSIPQESRNHQQVQRNRPICHDFLY